MGTAIDLNAYRRALEECCPIRSCGKVKKVIGLVAESDGPNCSVGSVCDIYPHPDGKAIRSEVTGFRDDRVLLMPLEDIRGISPGSRVVKCSQHAGIGVGDELLGRVIDGLGQPIDGKGRIHATRHYPIYAAPPGPMSRKRIDRIFSTGIRAIDSLLTIGCGQRMGIFAGSGVGKSVLLGMIARKSAADVNVIALIGERGREVNEFIEKQLGQEGLKRSVVVVATSDHLPLIRMRGAYIATAIAEYFRDQGRHVNLMMDSVTRFAMAQREIGLSVGEPPTTKGYTPSVFTQLPKLLERAGTGSNHGSITGMYTVLVEGDDMNDPIADSVRSILDGHVVLSREIAMLNHYPAIDVLKSISRVMSDIVDDRHRQNAQKLKTVLATYKKVEDLINIGAYVKGSNPKIDDAIGRFDGINRFLIQGIEEVAGLDESLDQLAALLA